MPKYAIWGTATSPDHAAWVEAESNRYQTITLMMNDYRVRQGTDVYAPVHLLNPVDVKNMDWQVNFDPAVAQLVEPSVLTGTVPLFQFKANPFEARHVLLGFAEDTPINKGGQLARIHFKAVGAPGSRTPLGLELKTARDPKRQPLPVRLVPGSIEVVSDAVTGRLQGSCCGLDRLVLEDALCALEMSVRLRPTDMIMNMNDDDKVDSTDAAIIVDRVMAAVRTGR